jgi:hypothetical protein
MCFKALEVTQKILMYCDENEFEKVAIALADRESLINIINKLSNSLNEDMKTNKCSDKESQIRESLVKVIEDIRKLDDKILLRLQNAKEDTQIEIARAFKNKENLKGYNLSSLK